MGVHIGDTLIFADDQVVLGEDEEDVNCMVRKLVEEYGEIRDKYG